MQYESEGRERGVKEFVVKIATEIAKIVGDDIIGVYLHGSLAMGGFNPAHSDIDLITVTEKALTVKEKQALVQLFLTHSSQPYPIEISFLNQAQLQTWQHPSPYDFHFSDHWRERYEEVGEEPEFYVQEEIHTDWDLAAHLTIMHKYGICLIGKPIQDVFPAIPKADYVSSILVDYEECMETIHVNPVYGILNGLRVYWYLKEGNISSKKEAGDWGARALPAELRPIVQQAAYAYANQKDGVDFAEKDLFKFRTYIKEQIEALRR